MIWLILSPVIAAFVIYTAFLALCTAKAIEARGVAFPAHIHFVAGLWLVVGVPADILYNWTFGAWQFREWWGSTFSSHVQRRVDRGDRDELTKAWANFLNAGASGHIKRVPEGWIV